jgi:hypothetical protein
LRRGFVRDLELEGCPSARTWSKSVESRVAGEVDGVCEARSSTSGKVGTKVEKNRFGAAACNPQGQVKVRRTGEESMREGSRWFDSRAERRSTAQARQSRDSLAVGRVWCHISIRKG